MFLVYVPYLRGGSEDSKFSQFQIFPKLGTGGGHRISNFSQIQKSPKHPRGGGGVKKIVDFFHFLGHFLIRRLPLEGFVNHFIHLHNGEQRSEKTRVYLN